MDRTCKRLTDAERLHVDAVMKTFHRPHDHRDVQTFHCLSGAKRSTVKTFSRRHPSKTFSALTCKRFGLFRTCKRFAKITERLHVERLGAKRLHVKRSDVKGYLLLSEVVGVDVPTLDVPTKCSNKTFSRRHLPSSKGNVGTSKRLHVGTSPKRLHVAVIAPTCKRF